MPYFAKVLLLSLALMMCIIGTLPAETLVGDLDGNFSVDINDLLIFSNQWLGAPEGSANLNGVDGIDQADFALLAQNWKQVRIPLFINEFMAQNYTAFQDPQGQYDDWIEIYNAGQTAIDLAGMYLTDDLDKPTQWRIAPGAPNETTINPGGTLLIWADGDVDDGLLHASFSLDAGGDKIALFDTDGHSLIDSVHFNN
ncbi:MAG: lamin tail domain-containing protein, partial [Phycisphaerae bacterium]|nr:lamin tail domain-containing protein [Phycisphaerae bacterium]